MNKETVCDPVMFVDDCIRTAVQNGASDIHIDGTKSCVLVQIRVDGIMSKNRKVNKELLAPVIARIKILAGLRSDIHDCGQDGRFSFEDSADIRVSIVPTYYGENAVLRLLYENQQQTRSFDELGCCKAHQYILNAALRRSQGMIIVAGPTGSGKTSTLYSMLTELVGHNKLIISLEDPVEYPIEGVRQVRLKPDNGYGFNEALRGILRQDPEVIMVGEIRDSKTASAAFHIALTGHLVLTSIHAEDIAHIIPRLLDMGIESYVLSATLKLLVSQRLVRKVISNDIANSADTVYQGRVGIFEMLEVSDRLNKTFSSVLNMEKFLKVAIKEGFTPMLQDALQKVERGITTQEEIKRVLYE